MPDWRDDVRRRLAGLNLAPAREMEIVDEVSQHLTDREASLLARGVAPDEARRITLDEIDDHELMQRDLERSVPNPLAMPPIAAPSGG